MENALHLIKERIHFYSDLAQQDDSADKIKEYLGHKHWWLRLRVCVIDNNEENDYELILEQTLEKYVGEHYNRVLRLQEIKAMQEGLEDAGQKIEDGDRELLEKLNRTLEFSELEIKRAQLCKVELDEYFHIGTNQ